MDLSVRDDQENNIPANENNCQLGYLVKEYFTPIGKQLGERNMKKTQAAVRSSAGSEISVYLKVGKETFPSVTRAKQIEYRFGRRNLSFVQYLQIDR